MSAPVVIVGVTGSIAAYKAADLVSKLVQRDFEVHVAMTHGAQEFVAPLTFQTLSRNPVITSAFDGQHGWKPGHIELADRASLLLIAPATANIVAELELRLRNAVTEMAEWTSYRFTMLSGTPEEDLARFRAIMLAERMRSRRLNLSGE